MKKITLQDIADEFNVTKVTVSKALNDKDDISTTLKENIKKRADELGYKINATARSLKTHLSNTIGVVVAERFMYDQSSFYVNLYGRLITSISKNGSETIIHIVSEKEEKEAIMPNMYMNKKVDGIIILGKLDVEYINKMKQIDIPILLLDNYIADEDLDAVLTDNTFSSYQITKYLFDRGIRKMLFVGDITATQSIQDRYLGFLKAHIEYGVPTHQTDIIQDRDETGRFIDLQLPKDLPEAFVCNCDAIAYELIKKLKTSGHKVPQDVSVVGFDGDIFSNISEPKITTIEVNVDEMANTTAKFISKKVKNAKKQYGRVFIKGKMKIQDSVRK